MQSAERPLLLIERLRVAYSGNPTPIIDGASLSLDRGEIGCVVGSSGCGKTTLLRAIAGFIGVEDGTIEQRSVAEVVLRFADKDAPFVNEVWVLNCERALLDIVATPVKPRPATSL